MSIRRISVRTAALALMGSAALALAACGGGEETSGQAPWMTQGGGGGGASTANTAEPAAEGDVAGAERVYRQIERRSFAEHARDPFQLPAPATEVSEATTTQVVPVLDTPDCELEQHPLGETAVTDLRLLALITGTAVPRAMVMASALPQAVTVSEGAYVGPNCTSRISEIRENEIVVLMRSAGDGEMAEQVISLHQELMEVDGVDDESDLEEEQ